MRTSLCTIFVRLPITDWVFAKTGENLLNFLLKTELSKKLFSFFKLNQFLENEKSFFAEKYKQICQLLLQARFCKYLVTRSVFCYKVENRLNSFFFTLNLKNFRNRVVTKFFFADFHRFSRIYADFILILLSFLFSATKFAQVLFRAKFRAFSKFSI